MTNQSGYKSVPGKYIKDEESLTHSLSLSLFGWALLNAKKVFTQKECLVVIPFLSDKDFHEFFSCDRLALEQRV